MQAPDAAPGRCQVGRSGGAMAPWVETILAACGIVVGYGSIREWGLRFGRLFASTLKRLRPKPGDKWFVDEAFTCVRGKLHYLWRAADRHDHPFAPGIAAAIDPTTP